METISESEETVVPENDARQEDNESYEKARQLFNQIPHEKSSKILPENDQQNKPFKLSDRESVQNSLPRDFNIEEIKNMRHCLHKTVKGSRKCYYIGSLSGRNMWQNQVHRMAQGCFNLCIAAIFL